MIRRLGQGARQAVGMLLLPLSALPFVLGVPQLVAQYSSFSRHYLHREALPAPEVRIGAAERARWRPLRAYPGAIPVLAYHGVHDERDHYSVAPRALARQLAMLKTAGFHTITPEQYARFLYGDTDDLPPRPILLTFDDGRLDTFRGADRLLERYGFRATNFVITGAVRKGNPFYLRWDELQKMARSGRWDLQAHARDGHREIRYDAAGHTGPAYAYRAWSHGHQESFADYRRRVSGDVLGAISDMRHHVPGFRTSTFALPYGSYGQWEDGTNDPRIRRFLLRFLRRRFAAVFVQGDDPRVRGRTRRGDVERFEVHSSTTPDQLYAWLRRSLRAARRHALRTGEVSPPVSRLLSTGPKPRLWVSARRLAKGEPLRS